MTARVCIACGGPIYWEQGNWYHGTPRKRVTLGMFEHLAIPGEFGECSTESGAA